MAAIASANVTYTITKTRKLEDGRKMVHATLAFGNGALTYPTGGVPLLPGSLGCPNVIDSFVVDDNGGSIYEFSFVKSTNALKLFGNGTHAHSFLLKNAVVADGATTSVNAGANLLGANTGSDITIAANNANGGIQNSAIGTDGAQVEVASSVAPAAQTLKITVYGY